MTEPNKKQDRTEVAVIGAGPAGLMAALALASAGVRTKLIGKQGVADNRTTALLAGSVAALESLGVWPLCRAQSAPLSTLRIVDDTGRLIRAPEVRFEASEIGLDAFGYNIENRHLVAALNERSRETAALTIDDDEAVEITTRANEVSVQLKSGGAVSAKLVIGADGRRSLSRAAAGIDTEERTYPQSALSLSFTHTRPHNNISTEFHTASGPFTLVPLPGNRSSLVWVMEPSTAEQIAKLDDATLGREIERHSQSILGKVTLEGARGLFPLSSILAKSFWRDRIALIGEAAHVMPPIGAQGLNLGLRDAATIAEIVADAVQAGRDPGSEETLALYDSERRQDVSRRSLAVDWLNRSLLTDLLPVQGARGLGLYLLDRIGPLRRAVMREGVAPASAQPRLMRGEAL
jgi:2-octaprenyl-6-methoxyphenol hydroxylase